MKRLRWDIERKILTPFLIITILATVSFAAILYYSGYTSKTAREEEMARDLVGFVQEDIAYLYGQGGPALVLDKYGAAPMGNILLWDADGGGVGRGHTRTEGPRNAWVVLESRDNPMGWSISYVVDRDQFFSSLIEEQKYVILATIALLLLIVQSSILIAGHISTPIRRLSHACHAISERPEETLDLRMEYTERKDEIGQLALSFDRMLQNIRQYTADLVRVKRLNETIVESLPIAVAAYGSDGGELLVNAAAHSLLDRTEYTSGGMTLNDIMAYSMENQEMFYDPVHLESPEGKGLDVELGVWRLTDEDGHPWGALCTMDDVTYKKLLEKRSHEDDQLVYAGKLAASLAHEIRNPLAGIRASVQVVERHLERELDRSLCQSIIGEVDRVNLLVENLVDLARRQELQKSLMDIPAFLDELTLLYSKVADNNHITMAVEADPDAALYADERAMKQIFINLINNSIRAMAGGGRITLRARVTGHSLVLSVEDDGCGMPEATLEMLNNQSGEGGIGTAVVAQLVGSSGGSLRWISSEGKGTRAVMTFAR